MKAKNEIPIDILRELVSVTPDGRLFWRNRPRSYFSSDKDWKRWNSRYAEKEAFNTANAYGYKTGRVLGVSIYAHRVVWALHTGAWPYPFLDHINGIRSDNRVENLRVVSKQENNRNARKRVDNKSGHTGITKVGDRFQVNVRFNGKQKTVGYYRDLNEAISVRDQAYKTFGYSERHGK